MGYLFHINMQQIADCFSASLLASFFFFMEVMEREMENLVVVHEAPAMRGTGSVQSEHHFPAWQQHYEGTLTWHCRAAEEHEGQQSLP